MIINKTKPRWSGVARQQDSILCIEETLRPKLHELVDRRIGGIRKKRGEGGIGGDAKERREFVLCPR